MICTFRLDGEELSTRDIDPLTHVLPSVGDRVRLWVRGKSENHTYVVAERWYTDVLTDSEPSGWHIVLRRPDTPAESTPPWERKENA